jgi:hypothetical protein
VPAVKRSRHADAGEHRRTAALHHQQQRLDRGLPFGEGGFLFKLRRRAA